MHPKWPPRSQAPWPCATLCRKLMQIFLLRIFLGQVVNCKTRKISGCKSCKRWRRKLTFECYQVVTVTEYALKRVNMKNCVSYRLGMVPQCCSKIKLNRSIQESCVVTGSACWPSTPMIRVEIPLKPPVFSVNLWICVGKERKGRKRGRVGLF